MKMRCFLTPATGERHFRCQLESELPTTGLLPTDTAQTLENGKRWRPSSATAWVEEPFYVAPGQAGPHTHPMSDVTGLETALAGKSFTDHNHDLYYATKDHTHPASGNGYVLNGGAANQATTTDGQTLYWGSIYPLAPTTTAANTRIYVPKAGIIKAATVFAHAATAGSAESWTMSIRVNNSTDWQIATIGVSAAQRLWANYALSVAVAEGAYVEIKEVCPTWATNPANVRRACSIYIE